MDSARFDAWIRSLALDLMASRRTTLHGLLGATLATSLLGLPNGDVEAKKKYRKHKKRKKRKKKNGGNDGCQAGETDCGNGVCADLTSDPNNCGACGVVSPTGGCRNGAFTCELVQDCPSGCTCRRDLAGENGVCADVDACAFEDVPDSICSSDADCALGTVCGNCISFDAPSVCTNPCGAA